MKTLLVLLCLVTPSIGVAQGPASGADAELFLASYDTVWQTVNDNHFDSTFGGVDWNEIHDRYHQKILGIHDNATFIDTVRSMLQELKLSHYAIFEKKATSKSSPMFSPGWIGLDIRLDGNLAFVFRVAPGSTAGEAGLKPGLVIESVDGVTVDSIIAKSNAHHLPHFNDRVKRGKAADAVLGKFFGEPGSEVRIGFRDTANTLVEKTVVMEEREGAVEISEELPTFYVESESKLLPGDMGYFRFSFFLPPIDDLFLAAMDSMENIRGLVIDIRGNPGGSHEIGETIVSRLLQEPTLFSIFETREGIEEVVVEPAEKNTEIPVVVLVDVMNGSAAERFPGCIQSIGRATIIGEWTPGSVGPSNAKRLPNGLSFLYLVAQSLTPDGTVLEGHGVKPDIEAALDREALLEGTDTQLERALEYLESVAR